VFFDVPDSASLDKQSISQRLTASQGIREVDTFASLNRSEETTADQSSSDNELYLFAYLINQESQAVSHRIDGTLALPWTTGTFSKKIPNCCLIDFSVMDERSLLWRGTRFFQLHPVNHFVTSYDHPTDAVYFSLSVVDVGIGKIEGILLVSEAEAQTMIVSLKLSFNLSFINAAFSKNY